jgi:sulfate adenylyltransferase
LNSSLVAPHGGLALVDRFVPPADAAALEERARTLPGLELTPRELADLELIATGAASPLEGFLGQADYRSVLDRMRLTSGVVWPLPLTLAVKDEQRRSLHPGGEAALRDARGRCWGTIAIAELYERDAAAEARAGLAPAPGRPAWLVGGRITALPPPADLPFAGLRFTPRQLREQIEQRGWRTVAGFHAPGPLHRAHEHLTKLALEVCDGLVIHLPLEGAGDGELPARVRIEACRAVVERYYPRDRALVAVSPAAPRRAGPREALLDALVWKNRGITSAVTGRAQEIQEIFDGLDPRELGVTPLRLDPAFYCRACGALASARTCPHDAPARLELSGGQVREVLRSGGHLPPELIRPEVAEILRAHYLEEAGVGRAPAAAAGGPGPAPARSGAARRGAIVWLTGLSGAGKSTLAQAIKAAVGGRAPVEILDGDEVRAYLSRGLGFSREDRDTNIHRIGYVVRLLARHGVIAVAAAISPYRQARDDIRALAEAEGIPFLEVYAQAEVAALARRDPKGLYEKALRGELAHFTGVSDPYEPPLRPEVTAFTDREPVEVSLQRVMDALAERGILARA